MQLCHLPQLTRDQGSNTHPHREFLFWREELSLDQMPRLKRKVFFYCIQCDAIINCCKCINIGAILIPYTLYYALLTKEEKKKSQLSPLFCSSLDLLFQLANPSSQHLLRVFLLFDWTFFLLLFIEDTIYCSSPLSLSVRCHM